MAASLRGACRDCSRDCWPICASTQSPAGRPQSAGCGQCSRRWCSESPGCGPSVQSTKTGLFPKALPSRYRRHSPTHTDPPNPAHSPTPTHHHPRPTTTTYPPPPPPPIPTHLLTVLQPPTLPAILKQLCCTLAGAACFLPLGYTNTPFGSWSIMLSPPSPVPVLSCPATVLSQFCAFPLLCCPATVMSHYCAVSLLCGPIGKMFCLFDALSPCSRRSCSRPGSGGIPTRPSCPGPACWPTQCLSRSSWATGLCTSSAGARPTCSRSPSSCAPSPEGRWVAPREPDPWAVTKVQWTRASDLKRGVPARDRWASAREQWVPAREQWTPAQEVEERAPAMEPWAWAREQWRPPRELRQ